MKIEKFLIDIDSESNEKDDDIRIRKTQIDYDSLQYKTGLPVVYLSDIRKYTISTGIDSNLLHIGVILNTDPNKRLVNVLYKNFLLNDPIKISPNVRPYNVQSYINGKFELAKKQIIQLMPRMRKLKRINLKMLNPSQINILYVDLDTIMEGYETSFGLQYAEELKARIITTEFFIDHNGRILVYNFNDNSITAPTIETEANFLCYFSFSY